MERNGRGEKRCRETGEWERDGGKRGNGKEMERNRRTEKKKREDRKVTKGERET